MSKINQNRKYKQAALISLRLLSVAFLLFVLLYSFYYMRHSPAGAAYFRLEQLHYEGLYNVDREALDRLVRSILPENLLWADLDRLRALVESESWVKSATIRRRLPDQIFIHIEERTPAAVAAIDNELYVVDAEGVLLDRYGSGYEQLDGPIVRGLRNTARENAQQENAVRMEIYLRVLEDFKTPSRDFSQAISEVVVHDPEQVAVVPDDEAVPVYLGHDHFVRRFQAFLSQKDLYDQLKERYGMIESVDVSFENKIIFHKGDKTLNF